VTQPSTSYCDDAHSGRPARPVPHESCVAVQDVDEDPIATLQCVAVLRPLRRTVPPPAWLATGGLGSSLGRRRLRFAKTLKGHDLRHSADRTGICYDNAMAESFFAALKNERVYRTQYPTREHAYRDIVRYIEFWYNSRRRHSGLQYRTPQQVHDEYLEKQSAA
jgi:transposase InsO family protein